MVIVQEYELSFTLARLSDHAVPPCNLLRHSEPGLERGFHVACECVTRMFAGEVQLALEPGSEERANPRYLARFGKRVRTAGPLPFRPVHEHAVSATRF